MIYVAFLGGTCNRIAKAFLVYNNIYVHDCSASTTIKTALIGQRIY